ncbi:hypothetical protein FG386_001884 [Cryptosporidium ryanae]|uniref:uncharacterized protein n=1 Tax=Cryptosporidium ryanae TaxID=515981 RepID=UPI003519DD22|nr:hypothetical protein FG386_001884 [Cryptosporidium ryanae]
MADVTIKDNSSLNEHSNGFINLIEDALGIDQKFILRALNITCMILSLFSLSMSYVAYKYNELLHMKLLLVLAAMLVAFSVIVYWYIPKLEEFLAESGKLKREVPSESSKKTD